MKKIFFEKTLILKTFFALFLLVFVFFFSNLFYNQKDVLADDEEDYGTLECGKEIPLGEAMEKTHNLLKGLVLELDSIHANASYQITAAEEMINLANQCDLSAANCSPGKCEMFEGSYDCEPCLDGYYDPFPAWACTKWSICSNQACKNPGPCKGQVCPENEIESEFEKTELAYNNIKSSNNKIFDLIDAKNESLCDKLNEDIKFSWETGCPKITTIEAIRRKLYLARNEFDKCFISPAEWDKIEEGELVGKFLRVCQPVIMGEFPCYTKTVEIINNKQMPVCTSEHNWFCCSLN